MYCVQISLTVWNMKWLKPVTAHPAIHRVILLLSLLDGRPAPVPPRDHVLPPRLVEGGQAEVLAGRLLHHVQGGVEAGAPLTYLGVGRVNTVLEADLYHQADPGHPGHIVEQRAEVFVQHCTAARGPPATINDE